MTVERGTDYEFKTQAIEFAFKFHYQARHDSPKCRNFIASPCSIHSILGLLYIGSDGETKNEIASALGLNRRLPIHQVTRNFRHWLCKHKHIEALSFANKIFVTRTQKLNHSILETSGKCFICELDRIDLREKDLAAKTINKWMESQTKGKLLNVVNARDIGDGCQMLVVSGFYVEAPWTFPFGTLFTAKYDFWISGHNKISIDMMYRSGMFKYGAFKTLGFCAIELPLNAGDLAMLIVLPERNKKLEDVEKAFVSINFRDLKKKLKIVDAAITLPKFTVDVFVKLKSTFEQLGIRSLFTEKADFSRLVDYNDPTRICEIFHRTTITITESGVNVSSKVTEPVDEGAKDEVDMLVDRPFLFALTTERNRILLVGCCSDPRAGQDLFFRNYGIDETTIHGELPWLVGDERTTFELNA